MWTRRIASGAVFCCLAITAGGASSGPASTVAATVVLINDDGMVYPTPSLRDWTKVRAWVMASDGSVLASGHPEVGGVTTLLTWMSAAGTPGPAFVFVEISGGESGLFRGTALMGCRWTNAQRIYYMKLPEFVIR